MSYASAGVDTKAGDAAVELMKAAVKSTYNSTVFGAAGGFAGMIDASELRHYRRPILATSTDGVGTKIELARQLDKHDTIGQDLVGMVVDDIAVVGAKPLLMTDYIACGKVDPQRIAQIVAGIARACAAVDTPLVGGETAEHPGVMEADQYDIAGAVTGVVEADQMLGAQRVCEGDQIVALASSGLHSNGYSLVRKIVSDAPLDLEASPADLGRTLGEELLEPTRLYSAVCLEMARLAGPALHAFSHITGGGLGANISRVMPRGQAAILDLSSWQIPPIFQLLYRAGNVALEDAAEAWNLGVGMVAICAPEGVDAVTQAAQAAGIPAWHLGEVVADNPENAVRGQRVSGLKGVDAGAAILAGSWRE